MKITIDVSDDDIAVLVAEQHYRSLPGHRGYYACFGLTAIAEQAFGWGMSQFRSRAERRRILAEHIRNLPDRRMEAS
jgi:hypothetical protein